MTPTAIEPISPIDFYAHRSGQEAWQYCPRRRYLAYHHLQTGIGNWPPIYFEIGTAVHGTDTAQVLEDSERAGLAGLMAASKLFDPTEGHMDDFIANAIDMYRKTPVYLNQTQDEHNEQETLIAGLLWTFWYRVWPQFTIKFEVLMVEQASVDTREFELTASNGVSVPARVHLCSRPDVIVRDRTTHEIVAINWKTINSITDERRQNIANSLQVNLEAYYAEKLYSAWVDEEFVPPAPPEGLRGKKLMEYYEQAGEYYKTLPRQIAYTQIIYLVKGARQLVLADGTEVDTADEQQWTDAEKFWRQDSFLCYRWVDLTGGVVATPDDESPVVGKKKGKKPSVNAEALATVRHSWLHRFYKEGNKGYSQLTGNYARQGIWEADDLDPNLDRIPDCKEQIKNWVHLLNEGQVFPSTRNMEDERNKANPLDNLIFFESPIYRDVDMQKEFVISTFTDEMDIAQRLYRVWEETDSHGPNIPEMLNTVLAREFPRRLISCRKPTRCEFDGKLCNVPQESRQPLFTILPADGPWKQRQPHHRAEWEAFNNA